jgi:hypothetical protein
MPTEEQVGTADLLAVIAPPFRLDGGPDIILSQRAPGNVAGATLWLQNPTNAPMEVVFAISYRDGPAKVRRADRFLCTLAPLEVGVLAAPISIRFTQPHTIGFTVAGPPHGATAPRVRAVTKGRLDNVATLKGILAGAAGLALVGVGHFTVTHIGGNVGRYFSAEWPVSGAEPSLVNAEATWTRIWAPADSPPTTFSHRAEPPRQVETMPSRVAYGVTLPAMALMPFEFSFASQFVGIVPGIALTLALLIASIYGAHAILKAAFPSLYPIDTFGSLVVRDGDGVTPAAETVLTRTAA